MSAIKRTLSVVLTFVLLLGVLSVPAAYAASEPETTVYVEDLGDGIVVKTTIAVYPGVGRNFSKSAISHSDFTREDVWIGSVTLKAFFTYNGMTAGVTGTEYAKSTASGWSYTNHKITTTTLSTSSGGTATLTATLKNFPVNVPVRLSLHCAPDGTITRG